MPVQYTTLKKLYKPQLKSLRAEIEREYTTLKKLYKPQRSNK